MHQDPRTLTAALVVLVCWAGWACGACSSAPRESPAAHADPAGLVAPAAQVAPAAGSSAKIALLVGIDDYPDDSGVPDLRGCGGDVERMRALLVERFGFAPADVVVLRDEQATHAAIVQAFQSALVERARPGTQAVFFFAGHGSRVPDADTGPSREPDGLDSTYVAYDSRSDGAVGEHDLVDDELRSLVAAVGQRGAFTTVLTDSCHSGGGLRSVGGLRARTVPQGRRGYDRRHGRGYWPVGVPYYDDSNVVTMGSYVHIGASRRDQIAGEIDVETAVGTFVPSGVMSYHLGQTLAGVNPGTTWGSAVETASLQVVTAVSSQSLTWSGAMDQVVFGSSYAPVVGWRARQVESAYVEVDAGYMHGLRKGSELDIRTADGLNTYGRADVESLSGVQARARFRTPPSVNLRPTALRAVEVGRPGGEPPLRLWCEVPGLEPWFAGSNWVGLASSFETSDYVVRSGVGGYQLWTPEGLPIPGWLPILPPTGADQLAWLGVCDPYLRREALWRSTSRLALESGGLQLDVSLVAAGPDDLRIAAPQGWSRWTGAPIHDRRVVGGVGGELPMGVFRVRNPGRTAVHLSVLNLPEDSRARQVIEPAQGADPRVLQPGETCSLRVGFPSPDPWPLERAMLDRYLFLATLQPFDTWALSSEVELRGADEAPLPGVLRQAQGRYAVRGSAPVDLDRSGFGVAAYDVFVTRPR